jgi:hypothetical protein
MQPLVSICIPPYNEEAVMAETRRHDKRNLNIDQYVEQ